MRSDSDTAKGQFISFNPKSTNKGDALLTLDLTGLGETIYCGIEFGSSAIKLCFYANTLKPLNFNLLSEEGENADANKFCDSDGCEI